MSITFVITLTVFVPFGLLYMRQPPRLDCLWAALCILGAVFFMFRSHGVSWRAAFKLSFVS